MLQVDEYEKIRRAYYIEDRSVRQIAREQGYSRKTVRKALGSSEPKPYQRQKERTAPVLGNYKARIEALLEENKGLPRKQRYTSHKIYQTIAGEGYRGSESGVRRYIGEWRQVHNRPATYLPLEFEPGRDAQADWGEGEVVMGGEHMTVQLFSIRLCYSRRLFVMAFPNQRLEAFLEAQVAAFHYFEGVPHRISYDNLKTAVKEI
jgi:transposase